MKLHVKFYTFNNKYVYLYGIQEIDMKYKREYSINCFPSSISVIDFLVLLLDNYIKYILLHFY